MRKNVVERKDEGVKEDFTKFLNSNLNEFVINELRRNPSLIVAVTGALKGPFTEPFDVNR